MIRMIAAVTKHNVIGRDNTIPWNYPGDFKFFKEKTLKSIIIMGLNTWRSLGEKPLPYRHNIIITDVPEMTKQNRGMVTGHAVVFVSSIDDAFSFIRYFCRTDSKDIWFIGGGSIYKQGLKYVEEVILTVVPDDIPVEGSILFPILLENKWECIKTEPHPHEEKLIVKTYRHRRIK